MYDFMMMLIIIVDKQEQFGISLCINSIVSYFVKFCFSSCCISFCLLLVLALVIFFSIFFLGAIICQNVNDIQFCSLALLNITNSYPLFLSQFLCVLLYFSIDLSVSDVLLKSVILCCISLKTFKVLL